MAIKPAPGAVALGAVTQGDAQALVDDLHASGLAASTVRNRLDPLRVIFRRARRRGQVTTDPLRDLDVPTGRGRRERVASREDAAALIDALPMPMPTSTATDPECGKSAGKRAHHMGDCSVFAGS